MSVGSGTRSLVWSIARRALSAHPNYPLQRTRPFLVNGSTGTRSTPFFPLRADLNRNKPICKRCGVCRWNQSAALCSERTVLSSALTTAATQTLSSKVVFAVIGSTAAKQLDQEIKWRSSFYVVSRLKNVNPIFDPPSRTCYVSMQRWSQSCVEWFWPRHTSLEILVAQSPSPFPAAVGDLGLFRPVTLQFCVHLLINVHNVQCSHVVFLHTEEAVTFVTSSRFW